MSIRVKPRRLLPVNRPQLCLLILQWRPGIRSVSCSLKTKSAPHRPNGEIDFALSRIEARLDKLVVDLDQRLTALEGGRPASLVRRGPWPVRCRLMRAEIFDRFRNVHQPSLRPRLLPGTVPAPARPVPSQPGVLGTIPKNLAVTKPRGREQCRAHVLSRPADVPTASVALSAKTPALPRGRQNHNTTTRYR